MGKTNQYADLQNTMAAQIWMHANGSHLPHRTVGPVPKAAKDAAADLIALYEAANGGPVDGEIHRLYQRYFEARHFEQSRPRGAALDKVFEHFARLLVDESEGHRLYDETFDNVVAIPTFNVSYDGHELTWEGDATPRKLQRRRRNPAIPSQEDYLGETLGSPELTSLVTNPAARRPLPKDDLELFGAVEGYEDAHGNIVTYERGDGPGAQERTIDGERVKVVRVARKRHARGKPPWLPNPSSKLPWRVPTIDELAKAWAYIEREYTLKEGNIDGEQWAEALAFVASHPSRVYVDADDRRIAEEMFPQLTEAEWRMIAARADYMLVSEGDKPRFKE